MIQKKPKLKIRQNKLSSNPLFIKFLNWQKDKYSIETMLEGIKKHVSDIDKEIVSKKILDEVFFKDLDRFYDKFKAHVYFNLGMAYYRSGNISSAVSCFQAAMAQDAKLLEEKNILKELREKGVEKFTADYNENLKSRKK